MHLLQLNRVAVFELQTTVLTSWSQTSWSYFFSEETRNLDAYIKSSKFHFLKILFTYFLEREKGRERGRETSICKRNNDQLPLVWPQSGTWPTTQACAMTRNWTGGLSVWGTTPHPLNHTSWGEIFQIWNAYNNFKLNKQTLYGTNNWSADLALRIQDLKEASSSKHN